MEGTSLHSGLEMRLNALAMRIAKLRLDIGQTKGPAKIVAVGEIEGLEQRYKMLEDQLHKLDSEGPGFRQDVKAEIEKWADDLTGTLENFVMRLDSQNLRAQHQ